MIVVIIDLFTVVFKTFDMDKSALILVKLPNLKLESLKRVKIWKVVG